MSVSSQGEGPSDLLRTAVAHRVGHQQVRAAQAMRHRRQRPHPTAASPSPAIPASRYPNCPLAVTTAAAVEGDRDGENRCQQGGTYDDAAGSPPAARQLPTKARGPPSRGLHVAALTQPAKAARRRAPGIPGLSRLREHRWSATERAVVISFLAIVMGSLFVTSYSLALGDPVPGRIDAALVGDPRGHAPTVDAVERVAGGGLIFHRYASVPAALHAIDEQDVYVALDLTSERPTLYVASAAGASVARVLEQISAVDPTVRIVDTHPLGTHDPNGVEIFYLMLVATIVGLITVLQVRVNAGGLSLRQWTPFVVVLAAVASFVFTLVEGPLLHRLDLPLLESWGILALHLLAVASFTSLMAVLIGRWAILPGFLFFVVLGNSSSGGAVAPPLLPPAFAFVSQWLPSGATVTALRDAVYFPAYQHASPIAVLAIWATALFVAMLLLSHRRHRSPGDP
jgi:hypothetical protein